MNFPASQFSEFHHHIQSQRYDSAGHSLFLILRKLQSGEQVDEALQLQFCVDFEKYILAPAVDLTRPECRWIYLYLSVIHVVFEVNRPGRVDCLVDTLINPNALKEIEFDDKQQAAKVLLLWGFDRRLFDVARIIEKIPVEIASWIIGSTNYVGLFGPNTENRIIEIISLDWTHLRKLLLHPSMIVPLSDSWMKCSNLNYAKKHELKKLFNHWYANYARHKSLTISENIRIPNSYSSKPKVLIALEQYHTGHAMHRCFHRVIEQLSDEYHTVAFIPENRMDELAKESFSEVIEYSVINFLDSPKSFIEPLQKQEFSAVYYPSLGMETCTLVLANARISSLQCLTLGHPATSYIPTIDFVLVQEQDFVSDEVFSEKAILFGNETSSTIDPIALRLSESFSDLAIDPAADQLEIAVVSTWMKINYDYLSMLEKVDLATSAKLHFHFFCSADGIVATELRHQCDLKNLKNTVYSHMDYEEFLTRLQQCQLRLSTFPFGGANSNMDCIALGVPFVVRSGVEPHAQSDVGQLQRASLTELIADSDEEYFQLARRLVEDVELRDEIHQKMKALRALPFFTGRITEQKQFQRSFRWMLKNGIKAKALEKRHWTIQDQQQTSFEHSS